MAYHWIGEPGDTRTITYADLLREVQKTANALKELGVQTGDRVAIYMPMIPELPIAMLACARIGAPHTVVFGGFSAEALAGRINDAQAKLLITADGGWRRGKPVDLKAAADEAVSESPTIEHVLVARRLGDALPAPMTAGRDVWWDEIVDRQSADCPPVPVDSEHMLYLLYTSGTTAKPKGIIHTTAGLPARAPRTRTRWSSTSSPTTSTGARRTSAGSPGTRTSSTGRWPTPRPGSCTRARPTRPAWDRWWQIVEDYKVSILYCAPTAIRAFMKQGEEWPAKHDLSSLRLLGSVGEPINPEAWLWYHQEHRRRDVPHRRHVVADRDRHDPDHAAPRGHRPPSRGVPPSRSPASSADVVDARGESVPLGGGGYLVLKRPWPAMLRGIYGDPERYRATYWGRFPGMYFAGDGAKRDAEGYLWLLGRVDDVMNVAGHRISAPSRSNRRWSITPPWPKPRSSARTTRSPARRSSRS